MKASIVSTGSLLSAFLLLSIVASAVLVPQSQQAPGTWARSTLGRLRSMNEEKNRQNHEATDMRPTPGDATRSKPQERDLSNRIVVEENQSDNGVNDERLIITINFTEAPVSQNYTNGTQNETIVLSQSQAPMSENTKKPSLPRPVNGNLPPSPAPSSANTSSSAVQNFTEESKQNNTDSGEMQAVYAPTTTTTLPSPSLRPSPLISSHPTSRRPSPKPFPQPTTQEPSPSPKPTWKLTLAPTLGPTLAPTIGPFGPIQFVGHQANYLAPYPLGVCQGESGSGLCDNQIANIIAVALNVFFFSDSSSYR
jgi:hypothetical protein